MARKYWAGLDVGAETTSICVVNDLGEILHESSCRTDAKAVHHEIRFIKRRRHARVCLEAGTSIALARALRTLGYDVDMFETRQLSKFLRVRRNKTDANDAQGIAQAGRLAGPLVSRVHMKSLDCQELASRLTIRRHLISTRVRTTNLLSRQLELYGGRVKGGAKPAKYLEAVEIELRAVFGRSTSHLVTELRHLLRRCQDLFAYQDQIDRELHQIAKDHEVCSRLMDIPGIGPICALTFYTSVADPNRFRKAADIGPYFGLTPKLFQSGLSQRMAKISKMGHRPTRTLLVQSSSVFLRCTDQTSALHTWARLIEARSGRGRARVALARKLATIMLAIWKSGARYDHKLVP